MSKKRAGLQQAMKLCCSFRRNGFMLMSGRTDPMMTGRAVLKTSGWPQGNCP
jgi:hypothetical protein